MLRAHNLLDPRLRRRAAERLFRAAWLAVEQLEPRLFFSAVLPSAKDVTPPLSQQARSVTDSAPIHSRVAIESSHAETSSVSASVSKTATVVAAPVATFEDDEPLLRFVTSGGQALGFGRNSIAVASPTGGFDVELVGANPVTPVADPDGASSIFGQVTYSGVWNGVTAVYKAQSGAVYDDSFYVAANPSGNPVSQIRLQYSQPVSLDSKGDLVITTSDGAMTESAPVAWQEINGRRTMVKVAFDLLGDNQVGFAVGKYDQSAQLVIDPITSNGTAATARSTNATSLTWSHTVNSGSDRALFVGLAINGLGAPATSVTYGGVALTEVGRESGNQAVELWELTNPTVGTANVVATFAGTTAVIGGAETFDGVDQTAPTGTFVGASGTGQTASVVASSAANDLVLDIEYWNLDPSGYAAGGSQTEQWGQSNSSVLGVSTTQPGAASVTMSSSVSTSEEWQIGAVSIQAAASPTVSTPGSASPSTVTGTTTALSVLGADAGGESNLTYTWAATSEPTGASPVFSANGTNAAQNTTVTFNEAGNYTFQATITNADGLSTTSSVNVTVDQTLTTLSVSPSTASVALLQSQALTVTGTDQFGAAIASPSVTWSVDADGSGSVDSSGLYTAGVQPGLVTVRATSGSVSGTALLTVGTPTINDSTGITSTSGFTVNHSGGYLPAIVGGNALRLLNNTTNEAVSAWWDTPVNVQQFVTNFSFVYSGNIAADSITVAFQNQGLNALGSGGGYWGANTVDPIVSIPFNLYSSVSNTGLYSNTTGSWTGSLNSTGSVNFHSGDVMDVALSYNGTKLTETIVDETNPADTYTNSYTVNLPSLLGGTTAYVGFTGGTGAGATYAQINRWAYFGPVPVVVTPAAANPSPVTGTTASLSVLGGDAAGESSLTYTWATTGTPPAPVTFSDNGDNSAKNTTATFTQAGSYNFQVTITDPGGQSITSSVNVTVDQTLTSITVTPNNPTLAPNGTRQLSATGYDQFGNSMSPQPSFTWTNSGGGSINSSGFYTAPNVTGSDDVTASSGGVSGSTNIIIADNGPTIVNAASASPSPVTGTTTQLSALGTDVGGASGLTYTWSTINGSPSGVTFSTNGSNGAQNTTATFTQAGSYDFQVTITNPSGQSVTSSVTVTVDQTLTSITVTPNNPTLTPNGTKQFSAEGYDQFGNAMSPQPTFTWTHSGGGSVSSTGFYTAPNVIGSDMVTASSGGVSGSTNITIADNGPTIVNAASASPSPVTGTTTQLSALGTDVGGASGLTYTWSTINGSPTGVSFSDNGDNTAQNTTATFTQSGDYDFQVTITNPSGQSVSSSVTVTVDQTLTSITVTPNNPTLAPNGTRQLSATGYDQFGDSMSPQPTFTWSNNGGGSINSTGFYTAPNVIGSDTVTASSGGVSGSTNIIIADNGPTIVNTASASPSPVTGTTTQLSALGTDVGGASGLTYTWSTINGSPSGVTFSDNGDNAAQNTTATFTQSGDYDFQVTIKNPSGETVTSSVTVTVDQTLTSITVTPNNPTLAPNGTRQLSATGYDQFGDSMSPQPTFTWSNNGGGSINSTGFYTAPNVTGSDDVTASSGGVSGATNITIADNGPTIVNAASASPSPVTGTTTQLSALGTDVGGASGLTYTWSTINGSPSGVTFSTNGSNGAQNSTATFTQSGDYDFQVTITNPSGETVTSSVTVTVDQTLTSITVTPVNPTLAPNGTRQLSATGYDQFGNSMSPQPTFTWSNNGGGSINSTGFYTAPNVIGSDTVTASSGGVSGSTNITIADNGPTIVNAASASPSPVTGTTTQLSALGTDVGGASGLTYTWSTINGSPTGVSFSDNGDNAAQNTTATFTQAGSYDFQVTITNPSNQSVTSDVNVTVDQTLSSITITPSHPTLAPNGTQQLLAEADDQFGNALWPQPSFTWSNNGGGLVSADGFYRAPAVVGSDTVTASSGGVSGSTIVTISDSGPTVATAASVNSDPVTGTTAQLAVLGADAGGESDLTYTWSTINGSPSGVSFSDNGDNAAQNTTATFTQAGDYDFQVTITNPSGQSVTSSVNVTVDQTLSAISISPASSSLYTGQALQFTAVGTDQFGRAMLSEPSFAWASSGAGSVDAASGLFGAGGAAGEGTVTASSGGVTSNAAVVHILWASPVLSTPAAASPAVVTGTTTGLSVLATEPESGLALTYTWSLVSGPEGARPTFSDNGDTSASDTTVTFDRAGQYTFSATIDNGQGGAITSRVNVTVQQTLSSILISADPSLRTTPGGTIHFAAVERDQFGQPMTSPLSVTWAVVSGEGNLASDGTFVAGKDSGNAVVSASAGTVTAMVGVSVQTSGLFDLVPSNSNDISIPASGLQDDGDLGGGAATIDDNSGDSGGGDGGISENGTATSRDLSGWLQQGSKSNKPAAAVVLAKPVAAPAVINKQSNESSDAFALAGSTDIRPIDRSRIIQAIDEADTLKWDQRLGGESAMKLRVGAASTIGSFAASAYLFWMLRGTGVLASLLSSAPAWRLVDPLFVLPSQRFYQRVFRRRKKNKENDTPEDRFFGKSSPR